MSVTLTDFLLARIANDEERARFVQRENEPPFGRGPETFEPWRLSWMDEYDLLCIEPERALAECEAKRRIVERCGPIDRAPLLNAPESARSAWDVIDTLNRATLRDLALPYADHPDYRPEWRP